MVEPSVASVSEYYTNIAIMYPDSDIILSKQAVGVAIAVLKWWTTPIIRKQWECRE